MPRLEDDTKFGITGFHLELPIAAAAQNAPFSEFHRDDVTGTDESAARDLGEGLRHCGTLGSAHTFRLPGGQRKDGRMIQAAGAAVALFAPVEEVCRVEQDPAAEGIIIALGELFPYALPRTADPDINHRNAQNGIHELRGIVIPVEGLECSIGTENRPSRKGMDDYVQNSDPLLAEGANLLASASRAYSS